MSAVWMLFRAQVRRSRAGLLGLVVVVAVVVAVVLTAAAGARRTSTTLDRYRAWSASSDAGLQTESEPEADALAARLRRLPFVQAAVTRYLVNAYPTRTDLGIADFAVYFDPHRGFGTTVDRARVLSGRLPAAGAENEVALTELSARQLHVSLHDHLRANTFDASDLEKLSSNTFSGFHGPPLDLTVVGLVRTPDELQGKIERDSLNGLAAPGFESAHPGLAAWPPEVEVRLVHGAKDLGRLQRAADQFAGGPGRMSVESAAKDYQTSTQNALDALSTALVVFALAAGAAGAVVIAGIIGRQIGSAADAAPVLRGLGLTRGERTLALGLPVVGAGLVGVVGGLGVSVLGSPLLPTGLGRRAEIHPGVWFDTWALAFGGALALGVLAAWALRSAWRSQRGATDGAAPPRPSSVGNRLAAWGASLPAVTGTRFAFEGGGRRPIPVRSALVGAAVAVAGVVGAGVVIVSLNSLVAQPARWGWTWSTMPDPVSSSDPTARLVADPDIAAVGLLDGQSIPLDHQQFDGYAMEPKKGHVSFTVLSGRLPAGPTEIALGPQTTSDLHASIGSTVHAGDKATVALLVVGTVVPPAVQGGSAGEAAVVTPDVLMQLAHDDVDQSMVVRYRRGTDAPTLERRLTRLGLSFPVFARPQLPAQVRNVEQARDVVIGLGGFFALLGVAGLVHALTVSCRRRRADFGVLRALGCRRRQLRRIVVFQSLAITATGLLVGVPLGLIAGRWVWGTLVERLGVVDRIATPWALLLAIGPVALLAAAVVALPPARLAQRRVPTESRATD